MFVLKGIAAKVSSWEHLGQALTFQMLPVFQLFMSRCLSPAYLLVWRRHLDWSNLGLIHRLMHSTWAFVVWIFRLSWVIFRQKKILTQLSSHSLSNRGEMQIFSRHPCSWRITSSLRHILSRGLEQPDLATPTALFPIRTQSFSSVLRQILVWEQQGAASIQVIKSRLLLFFVKN